MCIRDRYCWSGVYVVAQETAGTITSSPDFKLYFFEKNNAPIANKLADEPETLTPEQRISVWRWVVATCFIRELQEKNGTTEIRNEEGGVDLATIYSNGENALTIYPVSLRLCLASHFESILIEELGGIYKDYCPDFIIKAYIGFLDISLEHGPRLSEKGREGLCILHDDYIRELEANNGLLTMPTMH